jgi:L-threonylcarbamoyladenylate synthase
MTIISNCTASIIKDAALALKEGHLVAFPTETVYGLGADATNEKAVARIYEVKGRPTDHPLIVHVSSMELMDKWASKIPDYAINLARAFWPGPMTLILPRTELAKDFITGGQNNVGIRVPAHTVGIALLKEFEALGGEGIAAPSANRFGAVSPTSAAAVGVELTNYLTLNDQILDGGNCEVGIESTIIDCTNETPIILRPGAVTVEMIYKMIELLPNSKTRNIKDKIKAPGILESHYAPNATVILNGHPREGDGFIALASIPTPSGAVRLASPKNNEEYAHVLYAAFRQADLNKLDKIFVDTPTSEGLGIAILDRLRKASIKNC